MAITAIDALHNVRNGESALASGDYSQQRMALVVHAAGGLALLLMATVLSFFKPWGKTAHGKGEPGARKRYLLIGAAIALGIVIVLHISGGAPRHYPSQPPSPVTEYVTPFDQ